MLKPLTIAWCLCVITASVPMYSHAGSVYLQENAKLANGKPLPILEGKLGAAKNVHKLEGLYFAGQFSKADVQEVQSRQIKRVISLRTAGEVDWDEKGAVEAAGMEFFAIPFKSPDSLTDGVFQQVRDALGSNQQKTLLHCGSGSRVGGVWLVYRVLDEGVALSKALAEAKEIGLNSEAYEAKAIDYIQRMQSKQGMEKGEISVKPGINKNFVDPEMSVEDYVKRFEIESREVYLARKAILGELTISPGVSVADVGAGTGLFSRMFSKSVGEAGWVYAVDISPRFIEHINRQSDAMNLNNITGVLCAENSINLPPQSVDLVFVCDTYHHFEYPKSTLSSIYRALKPGGEFVVIDFDRVPGKSREWLLGHVRAGKEVFRAEIMDAGFVLEEEVTIEGFKENYFLRFRKK
ncbi:methyltransferase domain-containing protein [Mariniblastus sp.]|nr:methyltransferase domain-containing protein [Mariniblastus sp.]MDA9352868.1 methyltransferase domain-containing protein [bacterium]MDB4372482.1 methyltransferase domain-containing protein [Mariniblastus sp.]MDB4460511.1 methyltransferase domain-containing protein [bacterium]